MALEAIYLKKRIVEKGKFVKWHIVAVPGEWAIPDNPTTASKLDLDFLDPRMGWERAEPADIELYKRELAESKARAKENSVQRQVDEVLAQENAVAAVMTRVEKAKRAEAAPATKTAKAQNV